MVQADSRPERADMGGTAAADSCLADRWPQADHKEEGSGMVCYRRTESCPQLEGGRIAGWVRTAAPPHCMV
jgi:hypothetical protein